METEFNFSSKIISLYPHPAIVGLITSHKPTNKDRRDINSFNIYIGLILKSGFNAEIMNNPNNKFETLIGHAKSMLGCSFEGLKRKYIRYPICLMVYVEKGKLEKGIEIRFDNQEATVSCAFNQADICSIVYLFFDSHSDENNFIEYLRKSSEYDFRKKCWQLDGFCLKVRNTKDIFCFYLFR